MARHGDRSEEEIRKDLGIDIDSILERSEREAKVRQERLSAIKDASSGPAPATRPRLHMPTPRPDEIQQRRYMQLTRYGVPHEDAFRLAGGRTFTTTDATSEVDAFLREAQTGRENMLVLAGPMGTGKTVAACYFLEQAKPTLPFGRSWQNDEAPMFRHASELVAMGLYDSDEERSRLKRCRALVIDDLGAEYMDKHGVWLCFVDWLINARQGSAGYTCITTNLAVEDYDDAASGRRVQGFHSRYGERTYDRLREVAVWRDLVGPSMRGGGR